MIEVGEYVRTSRGIIGKLIRVEFDEIDKSLKWYVFLGKDEFRIEKEIYINKPFIKNHSKNIIDLIEVGDIVEIFDVLNEDVIYIWNEEMLKALKEDIKNGIGIRRILTHEQFEANCYKVEEE